MKFLCPSCKAKYQIDDAKVAGRSVRMKCRKCGYVIQVSSVAGIGDALPGSDAPPAPTPPPAHPPRRPPGPTPGPAEPAEPAAAPAPEPSVALPAVPSAALPAVPS